MESHLILHTHAVDSAIQLKGNNIVLKKRPPPISDKEQRLKWRQRCTLSQLWSWHYHLLQNYKHRVFGEPSDICTDCGASPQDVRHLFACATHPTDLSPVDLWRNPVRSIRVFSYLDNGNLDWLEDGPGHGKQQQLVVLCGQQCTSAREWSVRSHLRWGLNVVCLWCTVCSVVCLCQLFCSALMCCVEEVYNVCNYDMFSVVNVHHDLLKFCVLCINGRRYVCCSECNVVSN